MITLYTQVGNRVLKHDDDPFFRFPAGEHHMKFADGMYTGQEIALVEFDKVNHLDDLFKLQMWAQIVHEQGGTPRALIPYLPGAQADRGLPASGQIYADMINRAELDKVFVFDVHSMLAFDKIHNLYSLESVSWAASKLTKDYDGIIAPDKGAVDRAQQWARYFNIPVYQAEKTRNFDTGELTGFKMKDGLPENTFAKRYLIVDDVCVGGGTFIGLAEEIYTNYPYEDFALDLFVSHGVFSKGTEELHDSFHKIYTTDSYNRYEIFDYVTRIPLINEILPSVFSYEEEED